MGGNLVSERGFDPEEMITRSREEEIISGYNRTIEDPLTKQYISYQPVPKSRDGGKMGNDSSRGAEQAKTSESRKPGHLDGKQSKPVGQEMPSQSEEGNVPQDWTLVGKPREKASYRWVARGSTYPVKELLKKAGMRWDPQHKEWHSHEKPDVEIEGIYMMKKKE